MSPQTVNFKMIHVYIFLFLSMCLRVCGRTSSGQSFVELSFLEKEKIGV